MNFSALRAQIEGANIKGSFLATFNRDCKMKKSYLAVAAALMYATQANAAGYQLNEFSATGLGRAFAGMGIMGDDYSAMGYNPAGMTLVKRSGIQAGVATTQIYSKAESKYGTDKMNYLVPLPSVMGQYNVNDKLFLGAGIYVPFGLSTKYKHDSNVATRSGGGVRKSQLEVIDFNLSAAYKFHNGLSLGASAILRRITGQLTSNINNQPGLVPGTRLNGYSDYNVKGWSKTMQLGAMYEFNENTRIGLAYRFKSTQKTRGKHYMTTDVTYGPVLVAKDAFTRNTTMSNPELPASWILSGYHRFSDKWATSATVRYAQWHRFYTFPAKSYGPTTGEKNLDVNYKWKDSWTFSVGEEYYMNDNWTLRFGTAWDQTPVPNNDYRTNRIPDVDRIWAAVGASYMTGNHQFDIGYNHLFMMHGRTNTRKADAMGDMNVKYKSHSNMFALQYQYKF